MPEKSCNIVGPYYPIGDTEWMCQTHRRPAELRNPEKDRPAGASRHREDFFCPWGALQRAETAEAELLALRAGWCEHNRCPGGSLCCCQTGELTRLLERAATAGVAPARPSDHEMGRDEGC